MNDNPIFRIKPIDPTTHEFAVTLTIPSPPVTGQQLQFPAWIPGSYMIRDFARNVLDISASAGDGSVEIRKQDKQRWIVAPCPGPVIVAYRVYAWDLSVRAAYLDTQHGYFNGTSVFVLPVGFKHKRFDVEIEPPPPGFTQNWQVATTLSPVRVAETGFGRYCADNYEDLLDHPVEIADFDSAIFTAADIEHKVVLTGKQRCDRQRLTRDLARICEEHVALFDDRPPFENYLFLMWLVGDGYGGLEHRDSCSLMCRREDLPTRRMDRPTAGYMRLLGLCSHEYFHAWHVKRIRPAVFHDQDLLCETHTTLLWAFEGITSYYDDLALVRSGCIELQDYLGMFAKTITRVMRGPGRLRQSIVESSFDAWTKFYKQDENAPNAIVSYYAKGALVAFGLDMTLRDYSQDAVGLDDLMRTLWRRFGITGQGVGENQIGELAQELVGADLSAFFESAVYGTTDLPLAEWFASLGIGFRMRPATSIDDQGGYVEKVEPCRPIPYLGCQSRQVEGALELVHVFNGGPAQSAGLAPGDRVIAIDGIKVDRDSLARQIANWSEESIVTVHAFRRDELMTFALQPTLGPDNTCDLWLFPERELSVGQARRRSAWLASNVHRRRA